jgi:hypothetical protein
MIRILNLFPSENKISGGYISADFVLCLCDASTSAFTITIPSPDLVKDIIFVFKKTDSSVNEITIQSENENNYKIDGASSITLASQYAMKMLASDSLNYYLVSII